ncbi:MAG: RNA-directed DNA polymerase [Lachnospiraceae bacterium]|nr:RNA-directed DNA polymerase [Lachnospiraceae bacterium]
MNTVTDMNALYDAYKASMIGSAWKEEPQRFEIDFLSELTALHHELESRTYKTSKGSEFTLRERGKIRHIHGGRIRDRVVRHSLCDNVLGPALDRYTIYNNAASQKGKGIDFARKLFERDLHNFWLEHRTNEGYVAFVDLSKFYDNVQHEKAKEMILPKIDEYSGWLLSNIIDTFLVDVSYMSDEEYAGCMDRKFNSIEYFETIPAELKTGKKYMAKSVEIGDQTSQHIGVYYPTPIDNYVTIVRGIGKYGRYMDDMYIIHHDLDYLKETLKGVYQKAAELGLFVNEKKTRICRLSDTYIYLQVRYFMTDKGKVVKRINPKSITRERRKLKRYKHLMDEGRLTYPAIEQAYKSWMGKFTRIMSKKQIKNMKELYYQLFKEDARWKD